MTADFIGRTHHDLVRNIRLHALAWALTLPSREDHDACFHDFSGSSSTGFWAVNHRELGDYVLGFDSELGVVGLQYEPYRDHDAQGQSPPDQRTPEIYLRYPERSVSRARAVPAALEPLAKRVEKRRRGPSSSGLWMSEQDLAHGEPDPGWFAPYLRDPRLAIMEGYSANLGEVSSWAIALALPANALEDVLTILEWPWGEDLLAFPLDRAVRLVEELRHSLAYDEAKVPHMKKILARLGVAWPL